MVHPTTLVPEIAEQDFTYRNGRTEVIFTAPYPTEGPVCARDAAGRQVLMFMYAHFVFCWAEGAACVHVGHGTLGGARATLWTDVKISGKWCGAVLAAFGQAWTRAHLARFAR
ncbi:hypothetical protein [Amycolatopsis sp. H20-H5]|uniref:hypothetical protein n=1 Tax=Amycolatopsis sp. H20-H5 TaxID=3046309 RepID=UPI002DB67C32|nr:hypothetical protein [Amycolatopsis sp. H20-H5]MEC3980263.1 hypothetical protein [Amycolatopsis sp. H20-H5]